MDIVVVQLGAMCNQALWFVSEAGFAGVGQQLSGRFLGQNEGPGTLVQEAAMAASIAATVPDPSLQFQLQNTLPLLLLS